MTDAEAGIEEAPSRSGRPPSSALDRWWAPACSPFSQRSEKLLDLPSGFCSNMRGAVAAPQGYSFAKFGTPYYPSAGGLLEYDRGRYGNGHFTRDHCLADSCRNANVIAPATDHRDRRDLCPKHGIDLTWKRHRPSTGGYRPLQPEHLASSQAGPRKRDKRSVT